MGREWPDREACVRIERQSKIARRAETEMSQRGGPMQSGSIPTGRLDPRIGAAAPELYKSVRDAKDWENPCLVIGRDGIEVIGKQLPSGRQTVAVADLERTLIRLPVSAWPLREGRCGAGRQRSRG